MRRFIFALKKSFIYRKELKKFMDDSLLQLESLEAISAKDLDAAHVAVLVLDFDGVLASHGEVQPCEKALKWLKKLSLEIGEQRIVILTNKPFAARISYMQQTFPSILLVSGIRKKPYPDGLYSIALQKGVPIYRLLLIDDRLLTGILATQIANCQARYFVNPEQSFKRKPIPELCFASLRIIDKFLLKSFNFLFKPRGE